MKLDILKDYNLCKRSRHFR